MADNIAVTEGSGKTVKTTDVAGEQIQHIIIDDITGTQIDFDAPVGILGVDGTSIATNANPFPISDAGGTLTVDQSTAANLNATIVGSGSAATPAAGVVSVQGFVADDAAAGTTNPVPVGGRYNATSPTYTDGDRTQAQFSATGGLRTKLMASATADVNTYNFNSDTALIINSSAFNMLGVVALNGVVGPSSTWERQKSILTSFGTPIGVAAVEQAGSTYLVKSDATGTTVKSGAGILHKVVINTLSAGTISLYDATSATGTPFAVINSGVERDITYDLGFATGLHAVFSATPNVTFVYR